MSKALAWGFVTDKQNFNETYIEIYQKNLGKYVFTGQRFTKKIGFQYTLTNQIDIKHWKKFNNKSKKDFKGGKLRSKYPR